MISSVCFTHCESSCLFSVCLSLDLTLPAHILCFSLPCITLFAHLCDLLDCVLRLLFCLPNSVMLLCLCLLAHYAPWIIWPVLCRLYDILWLWIIETVLHWFTCVQCPWIIWKVNSVCVHASFCAIWNCANCLRLSWLLLICCLLTLICLPVCLQRYWMCFPKYSLKPLKLELCLAFCTWVPVQYSYSANCRMEVLLDILSQTIATHECSLRDLVSFTLSQLTKPVNSPVSPCHVCKPHLPHPEHFEGKPGLCQAFLM